MKARVHMAHGVKATELVPDAISEVLVEAPIRKRITRKKVAE